MTKTHRRATIVATLVLLAGVTASLAGNLQAINLHNHRPGVGAYISAVIWPLFLFAAIEILLHTPWLSNWRDRLTKGMAVAMVGGVAAYVSYFHLANVLSNYGYDVASRYAGPLAIDACMAMATLALNRVGHARRLSTGVDTAVDVAKIVDKWVPPMANTVPLSTDVLPSYSPVDEAEHYLDRVAKGLDGTTTPAVPIVPGKLPQRTRKPVTEPAPSFGIDADEASELAHIGVAYGAYNLGEISELLGGYYGKSARTIRRQPWWPLVSGRPVSAPPAGE